MRFHKNFTSEIIQMIIHLHKFFKEKNSLQNSNIKTFFKHKNRSKFELEKASFQTSNIETVLKPKKSMQEFLKGRKMYELIN